MGNYKKLKSYLGPKRKKIRYDDCVANDQIVFTVLYVSPCVKDIGSFNGSFDFLGVFSNMNGAYKCGVNRLLNDLFIYVEFHNSLKSRKKVDLDNDFVQGKTNELSIREFFHYVQCYFNDFFNPKDECFCTIVKLPLSC